MIQLFHDEQEIAFEITTFPDLTSQVWKLNPEPQADSKGFTLLWTFESEVELIHVLQLAFLLKTKFKGPLKLKAPYLPYARQDKEVSPSTTWALHFFAKLIKDAGIDSVETFDQHSPLYFISQSPQLFHKSVIHHDFVCFPDKGARSRYPHLEAHAFIDCEKVRDQSTGQITGMTVTTRGQVLSGKTVIIIDDICDGGRTFTEVAKKLNDLNVAQIDLAVSHGLFSQGREVLHQAGIKKIYTTNSLIKNSNDFKVW